MPRPRRTLATLVFATLALACSKKPPEATVAPDPSASASATVQAAPPPSPAPSGSALTPIGEDQSIGAKLSEEVRNRKPGNPSVEQVFALCEKLGAPVPSKEQTVAKTYRASYCVGGFTTDKKLTINVCEYPDEASVAAGAEMSKKLFKALQGRRQVLAHKNTTLTLFTADDSDASKALAKKLGDAFLAM